ncbi:MAG: hypothetical protein Q9199_001477 [Rusavskia elegans]
MAGTAEFFNLLRAVAVVLPLTPESSHIFVLCAASLVSAVPSKLLSPGVSIQVSFEENHEVSAIQPIDTLPGKFTLEATSDKLSGASFGCDAMQPYAPLRVDRKTTFFLREGKLMVSSDYGDLAVGMSPLLVYPPAVVLLPENFAPFEMQAFEMDGTYIEMAPKVSDRFGQMVVGEQGRVILLSKGVDSESELKLKVHFV